MHLGLCEALVTQKWIRHGPWPTVACLQCFSRNICLIRLNYKTVYLRPWWENEQHRWLCRGQSVTLTVGLQRGLTEDMYWSYEGWIMLWQEMKPALELPQVAWDTVTANAPSFFFFFFFLRIMLAHYVLSFITLGMFAHTIINQLIFFFTHYKLKGYSDCTSLI